MQSKRGKTVRHFWIPEHADVVESDGS
jgi:hypothetical protein